MDNAETNGAPNAPGKGLPILCPSCQLPFDALGTSIQNGVAMFFHNNPSCMRILGFQMLQIKVPQNMVQPSMILPAGRA